MTCLANGVSDQKAGQQPKGIELDEAKNRRHFADEVEH